MSSVSMGFLQSKHLSVRVLDFWFFFSINYIFFLLFSIKMCTNVNHKDLITVHHEMMHVQYFMSYRHQPKVFRDGANPGKNISQRYLHYNRLSIHELVRIGTMCISYTHFHHAVKTFIIFFHLNTYNDFSFQSIRLLVLS